MWLADAKSPALVGRPELHAIARSGVRTLCLHVSDEVQMRRLVRLVDSIWASGMRPVVHVDAAKSDS